MLARSGSGKSFATKLGVLRGLCRGVVVYVLDRADPEELLQRIGSLRRLIEVMVGERLSAERRAALDHALAGYDARPSQRTGFRDFYALPEENDPEGLAKLLRPFATGSLRRLLSDEGDDLLRNEALARLLSARRRSAAGQGRAVSDPDRSHARRDRTDRVAARRTRKAGRRRRLDARLHPLSLIRRPPTPEPVLLAVTPPRTGQRTLLGLAAFAASQGYSWLEAGEVWNLAALCAGTAVALIGGGWAWRRWKRPSARCFDPQLIEAKTSRGAFEAELELVVVPPARSHERRAREVLDGLAAAYRHYDHPAGARFRAGGLQPLIPAAPALHPQGPGLFGRRSVLGVREVAALWHPPGAADESPLVARAGAPTLPPAVGELAGGAAVGVMTETDPQRVRFPDDLLRRHHPYVARTRMGKSTLMRHIVGHTLRNKAEGLDSDAVVVVDPHADLVAAILDETPDCLDEQVRLIDLADPSGAPRINLLDAQVFADRDRSADSVVSVARGLWEPWGPRMQSILEQTVKTLHEANSHPLTEPDEQHAILDGLRLLSDDKFRDTVLTRVSDPYLLEWWARRSGARCSTSSTR